MKKPRPTLEPEHPLFGLGYAKPVERRTFVRYADGEAGEAAATVAEETPVALVYNGWSHAVMMCTPADVEDFAYGFTISEEIAPFEAIEQVRAVPYSQGIEVAIAIPPATAERLRERGRSLVGRTGCGLCGVETIDEALRGTTAVGAGVPVARQALFRAGAALPSRQTYNEGTGAVHAAAWASPAGDLLAVREDVGRHNALDKLIGALARARVDTAEGFVLITSRASYELIQKCAVAGITTLAAVSRPTGLAVRMAEACGMTLAALLRGESVNVYAHPERVQ